MKRYRPIQIATALRMQLSALTFLRYEMDAAAAASRTKLRNKISGAKFFHGPERVLRVVKAFLERGDALIVGQSEIRSA